MGTTFKGTSAITGWRQVILNSNSAGLRHSGALPLLSGEIMYDPPIEIPGSSESCEADDIEMKAADRAYKAGLGVGEWEAFLQPEEVDRLIILGESGFGTWGHEPHSLERAKASR